MIVTEIVPSQIVPFPADDSRRNDGSEIVFNGRVRSTEQGEPILALEYEHYEGMAETELNRLAEKTVSKFSIHDLFCRHRVGQISVGEISLHVVIWSKHRKEGLSAMTWFIVELKKWCFIRSISEKLKALLEEHGAIQPRDPMAGFGESTFSSFFFGDRPVCYRRSRMIIESLPLSAHAAALFVGK